jgi:hypothetical protein
MSVSVKWFNCVSSYNLIGDGLIANIIRLEGHYCQNVKLDIIGIGKTYLVWNANQTGVKEVPVGVQRGSARILFCLLVFLCFSSFFASVWICDGY